MFLLIIGTQTAKAQNGPIYFDRCAHDSVYVCITDYAQFESFDPLRGLGSDTLSKSLFPCILKRLPDGRWEYVCSLPVKKDAQDFLPLSFERKKSWYDNETRTSVGYWKITFLDTVTQKKNVLRTTF